MLVQGLLSRTAVEYSYSILCYYLLAPWQFWKPLFITKKKKKREFWYRYFFISYRVSLSLLGTAYPGKNALFLSFFFVLNKRTRIFYSATIITFQLAHSSKNEQFTRVTYAGACLCIFILSPAWKELNRAYKWWIQSVLGYKTTKVG